MLVTKCLNNNSSLVDNNTSFSSKSAPYVSIPTPIHMFVLSVSKKAFIHVEPSVHQHVVCSSRVRLLTAKIVVGFFLLRRKDKDLHDVMVGLFSFVLSRRLCRGMYEVPEYHPLTSFVSCIAIDVKGGGRLII